MRVSKLSDRVWGILANIKMMMHRLGDEVYRGHVRGAILDVDAGSLPSKLVNVSKTSQKLHVNSALIELHYMPCIAYFSALSKFEQIVVEKFEHYQKQSYRNRCYIKGPHQVETLIIPVTGKGSMATIAEVRIDYGQKWLNSHWRTIRTAYGKAPFFEYYAPELEGILFKKHTFLYDLNRNIMTLCLKWLKMGVAVTESTAYEKKSTGGAVDLRGLINPKKEDGCNRFYESIEYHQVFGSKFVPNLSLIDLIFNQGPGAPDIVKASALK